jgi:uncharacterized protein (TIRG00374 family)
VKRKRVWSNLLRIFISVLTLALLLRQVGGQQVFSVLRVARLTFLLYAWLVFLVGIIIRVFRWRALLQGLDLHPPFWQLLELYLIGGFFNTFLPSGFGGDIVRILELAQGEHAAAAAGTVIVDRLTGLLSLMAMGLVVLPFAPDLAPWLFWTFLIISVFGLTAGFVLLQGKLLRSGMSRISMWLDLPGFLSLEGAGILARIYQAVSGCGSKAVWSALLLSSLFNIFNIMQYWLCALAVGITVNLSFHFVAVPLLALTLLIPISIGGLGARDWVAQPLMKSVDVAEPVAAAWTLSVWVVTGAAGLIGGFIYIIQAVSGMLSATSVDPVNTNKQ